MKGAASRLLSVVLALAMAVSMISATSIAAFAEATNYDVTVSQMTHGEVTASPTAAAEGTTVTLTVTPDTDYALDTLTVKDSDGSDVTATQDDSDTSKYTFTMPAKAVTVSATFKTCAYLDSNTTSKDIAQTYSLTTTASGYTDATKVKLEWTVTDISVTRSVEKVWDPDTLTWTDSTDAGTADDVTISANGGATFTLTNLSSVKVNATASFKAESGFSPSSVTFGGTPATKNAAGVYSGSAVTLGTVVQSDKSVDTDASHSASITAVVTPAKADFTSAAAATGAKYGTYTVTLSPVSTFTVTLEPSDYFEEESISATTKTITGVASGTTWSISDNQKTLTIGEKSYTYADLGITQDPDHGYWELVEDEEEGGGEEEGSGNAITKDTTFKYGVQQ